MRPGIIAGLALVAVVGWALPAAAAEPTLGGTLSPVPYYADQSSAVNVTNRATVPVIVALEGTEGWTLGTSSVPLEPGQRVSVPVTGIGSDGGLIRATFRPAVPVGGTETTALVLETRAAAVAPVSPPWGLLGLLGLLAALVVVTLARRVTRSRRHA